VYVNIYDLIDAKRDGVTVPRFSSQRKLAQYTITNGKIFPKAQAKSSGPVRILLKHIM
jgi:hypothetical protein